MTNLLVLGGVLFFGLFGGKLVIRILERMENHRSTW